MLLLEQNSIRNGQINKFLPVLKFGAGNNKEYEIKAIQNSAVYIKKEDKYLPRLYNLVT